MIKEPRVLPATATCGNCLTELRARMVIEEASACYNPARWIIFNFSNWHMEYFACEDTSMKQPIYACPACHRLLSYTAIEGNVYVPT